jgi:hypothetical protein
MLLRDRLTDHVGSLQRRVKAVLRVGVRGVRRKVAALKSAKS